MFRINFSILQLLIILTVFACPSCHNHQHPGKKIFRYNESSGISSLDPAYAKNQAVMWPVHQLYNTLVEVDASMQIVPSIARSWVFSADKKSIRFLLRNDVYFHNDPVFKNAKGRKLSAGDVVFSFARILDPLTASPGAWIFNNRADTLRPFVAVSDSVFELNLLVPYQPILGILSMQYCSIVPREAVEGYGSDFRRHPVGTGPFVFRAWEEGQALILSRNEHYFEKDSSGNALPYLDGIKVSFFESKATEFLEFRQGRLDFVNDFDASFKDEILTRTGNLKKNWDGKLVLHKHPYLNIEFLGVLMDSMNPVMKNSPLRSKKVRQAISYGIDRKKMMLYLRNSIGTPATAGFIPLGLPSFDSLLVKGYRYDPAKAKQLLAEAGYVSTVPVRLFTIPAYASLGGYIVNELKQLGINAEVETVQKSLLLEQTSKSQIPFYRGSWIADYPDAENYLGVFYSKNPAPPNYTRYANPRYDSLFEKALLEINDSARYSLYREMDRIIIEDVPVVPLWYDMVMHLVQPDLTGFYPNGLNMLELRKVRKGGGLENQ
jgi:peptide/nickel transport system substrate-binding protein